MSNSLAQLTDIYNQPETIDGLPVESVPIDTDGVRRVRINTSKPEPDPALSDFNTIVGTKLDDILNKLTGANGQQRYQLWPEKLVREGLSAAGDVMNEGTVLPGLRREDITDIPKPDMPTKDSTWLGKLLKLAPVGAQPGDTLIEKAQAISALAGTGGLVGGAEGAALNATPSLRPALKYKDKLYKGKPDQQHMDIIPKELYPEFERMAMSGEDISHYNFGFVNDKGHFLDREKALEYGINNGLIDPHAGKYGALTSTLMADSSKPGVAIEAAAKTASPFFSALEHNVSQISQSKMTGDQWLGTLSNKPGVKPEELQWTGLGEFLKENAGKPVTKVQIQEHLAGNKVELKEVSKGEGGFTKNEKARYDELNQLESTRALTNSELKEAEILHQKAKQTEAPTKYHSYQLPGGDNYREMLLTLPGKKDINSIIEKRQANDNKIEQLRESMRGTSGSNEIRAEIRDLQLRNDILNGSIKDAKGETYKSSHWDEPNILAHVRMNDRTVDGKKSLHLEEIQSDWHQQGRDKGYNVAPDTLRKSEKVMSVKDADPLFRSGLKQNGFDLDKIANEKLYVYDHNGIGGYSLKEPANATTLKDWIESGHSGTGTVPDAPFKKSWHELALKRMIREAAEKGYDRLSWTPGEAQAARYDLSKQVSTVVYKEGKLTAVGPSGQHVINDQIVGKDKLSDYIGKEAAKKLLEQEPHNGAHTLQGEDLKIGGEGMKGFYDKMIPSALEKIGKEHGVKVKSHMLETNPKGWHITPASETVSGKWMVKSNDYNSKGFHFDTKAEAEANLAQNIAGERAEKPIHYIDLPQSLKDQAMHKGFPLFSKGGHMLMPVDHEPDFGDKK